MLPLGVLLVGQARRLGLGMQIKARDRDVRCLLHGNLLGHIAQKVAYHCAHLGAQLHLRDASILVHAAARDALEQLVEVERRVLPLIARLALRHDKVPPGLRQ